MAKGKTLVAKGNTLVAKEKNKRKIGCVKLGGSPQLPAGPRVEWPDRAV